MQSLKITVVANEMIFDNPPFKQCHASTLVEMADGRIMAAWFSGPYDRHRNVCIWASIKSQAGRSQPVNLAIIGEFGEDSESGGGMPEYWYYVHTIRVE